MKKQVLTGALCAALWPATAFGQALVVSADFEAETFPPAGWTVLDQDGDGHSWQRCANEGDINLFGSSKAAAVSFCGEPGTSTIYGAQDNWLISPAFTVPNDLTTLTFNYVAQSTEYTEPMEVLISEGGAAAADFTSLEKITVQNQFDWDEYETVITNNSFQRSLAAYKGKSIRVAIRHTGNRSYALSVDNFSINDLTGPTQPTGFSAKADADGGLSVALNWTNPSRDGSGSALTALKINIFRDGVAVAQVDGTPGQAQTWTDATVTAGRHSYTIQAENASGAGAKLAEKTVTVGEDIPAVAKNMVAVATPGQVVLSWEAPTQGANKGAFNAANVTYRVVALDAQGAETELAKDLAATTFTDRTVRNGNGGNVLYAVYAVNASGTSARSDVAGAVVYDADANDMAVAAASKADNSLERLPIDISSTYSVTQSLYTPADLNYATGTVKTLVYKIYKGTDTELNIPVRIYIHETDADALTAWLAPTEADKVFEGTMTLEQGYRDVAVDLGAGYAYKGGNLVITFIKDGKPSGAYSDRFLSAVTAEGRSYTGGSAYDPIDIASLPVSSYSAKSIAQTPYTRFIMDVKGVAAVSGKVTDSATGAAVKGATVTVAGYDGVTTATDAEGAYAFRYVPVGATQMTVTVPGYADKTVTLALAEGTPATVNVQLDQLANYALSGNVTASDTKLPAEGAVVKLSGYDEMTVTADAKGDWTLEPVYAGKDYTLSISYPLYDTYTAEVNYSASTALESIVLERAAIAPFATEATVAADGSHVDLTWSDPQANTAVPGWNSVGDVSDVKGTTGDNYYSPTDYNMGHAYTVATVTEKSLAGASVVKVRAYIKATEGTFTAKVWKGTRTNAVELGSAEFAPKDISADGAWVEATFAEPVELRAGEDYLIGVNCKNASKDPIGYASSKYISGANNVKWDANGINYNGYDPYCVEALFEIPGSAGPVVANPDVPGCEYKVYRRKTGESEWTELTASPVKDTAYSDPTWATLLSGEYTYGVTAMYRDNESPRAYSYRLQRSVDTDAGVVEFISPVKSVEMQTSAEVKVVVANYGEKPASNIPVSVSLNGGTPVTATYAGTLNKGEQAEFTVGTIELPEGVHTLRASTALEGDEQTSNDACEMILPNMANISLYGYRWNAYGNAGFMNVESNNPEGARYLLEMTHNDALLSAGEYVNGSVYAYTATWYGSPKNFIKINPTTWTVESSKTADEYYITEMAYSHPTSTMYALNPTEDGLCYLVTVDLDNGATTVCGTLTPNMHALACDTEGNLFAMGNDAVLYKVDPATAAVTAVGATGVNGNVQYLQSMAFDHNTGRLFWSHEGNQADGELTELDPATGKATVLGNVKYMGNEACEMLALHTPYTYAGVNSATTDCAALSATVTRDGHILVTSADGAAVEFFTPAGATVARMAAGAGTTELVPALSSGIYMVRVSTAAEALTLKVAVK